MVVANGPVRSDTTGDEFRRDVRSVGELTAGYWNRQMGSAEPFANRLSGYVRLLKRRWDLVCPRDAAS